MTGRAIAARRPWNSVRLRLLVGLTVVTVLGLTGGGAATFLVQRARVVQGIDLTLKHNVAAARAVVLGAANSKPTGSATTTTPKPFTSGSAAVRAIIAQVLPGAHESSLGIVDRKAAFVSNIPAPVRLEDEPGFVARMVKTVADGKVHIGTVNGTHGALRFIAAPVTVSGSTQEGVYVAAIDVDVALGDLTAAFSTFWVVVVIATLLVASLGWFIAGRLLRPIHLLEVATSRVTSTHRNERIPVVGTDDVSRLARTVNLMMDRLDAAMTDQRQLLDDVRHELHTPITIVRGHLEVLDPNDPLEVIETKALAIDELDRVSELVEGLALLAETQRSPPTLSLTNLNRLSNQVLEKVTVLPDHHWELTEAADVDVMIDTRRVTQAWLQLLDNAAKYSPVGSPISFGSRSHVTEVQIWVANEGPEIPQDARQRIFERFGRADTGRGIAGSGLGLSIVQAIAVSHSGRVTFESDAGSTVFSLFLPVVKAAAEEAAIDG